MSSLRDNTAEGTSSPITEGDILAADPFVQSLVTGRFAGVGSIDKGDCIVEVHRHTLPSGGFYMEAPTVITWYKNPVPLSSAEVQAMGRQYPRVGATGIPHYYFACPPQDEHTYCLGDEPFRGPGRKNPKRKRKNWIQHYRR